MGVSVTANGSKQSFQMGGGGFFNLRRNIALAFDKEFGEHYSRMPSFLWNEEMLKEFDRKTNEILSADRFSDEDEGWLDFLFQSDCEGSISHKTCKKIYDAIKDVDFSGKTFVYAAHSDGKDYEHFKDFLLECYSHRRKMRWS